MLEAYKNYYISMWELFKETWWMGIVFIMVAISIFVLVINRKGR